MRTKRAEAHPVDSHPSNVSIMMNALTFLGIAVLFGFACCVLVSQYPHPKEDGVILYTMLALLTLILNLIVTFPAVKRELVKLISTKNG